jgi:hypothetical protein
MVTQYTAAMSAISSADFFLEALVVRDQNENFSALITVINHN